MSNQLSKVGKRGLWAWLFIVIAGLVLFVDDAHDYFRDRGYITFGLPATVPQASRNIVPTDFEDDPDPDGHDEIGSRSQDDRPMSLGEVFWGDAKNPQHANNGSLAFSLHGTRLDDKCSQAVWGAKLAKTLTDGGCSQVVRGLYGSDDGHFVGIVAIFNMRDAEAASRVVIDLHETWKSSRSGGGGLAGFVLPLKGPSPLDRLGEGMSNAAGDVDAHFVIVSWLGRNDGSAVGGTVSTDDELIRGLIPLSNAAHDFILRRWVTK
jgi:hypothetical protein